MEKEKVYLGISLGFNASACLYSNTRGIIAAISQEKINKVKNTKEIPIEAILKCCEIADVYEIEEIAYSHYQELTMKEIRKYVSRKYTKCADIFSSIDSFFIGTLETNGINVNNHTLKRIEHHTAHSFSGFGIYGMEHEKFFTITSDGFGDGFSARITAHGFKEEPVVISELPMSGSLALIYQFTTGALGYKEHQNEGKVTGLSAFGKPLYLDVYENMFIKLNAMYELFTYDINGIKLSEEEQQMVKESTIIDFDVFLKMKKDVYATVGGLLKAGAKPEDIATSLQKFTEKAMTSWIKSNIVPFLEEYGDGKKYPVYLAGGIFANCLVCQRINEMSIFSNIYVAPATGDEGNCIGSAIYAAFIDGNRIIKGTVNNQIAGPKMLVDMSIIGDDVEVFNTADIINYMAHMLARRKTICLVEGRLEFGARALCHRSILVDATDKDTNIWLNKLLGRNESMPFAPVVMEEDAESLFENIECAKDSAKFMALTFKSKQEFLDTYKAVYHVDLTARPQLINPVDNEFMYSVLERYKELTGHKVLINTSFNMHNQPIVSTFEEAYKSWRESNIDILIVDGLIFVRG